jgi:hypothetical protein
VTALGFCVWARDLPVACGIEAGRSAARRVDGAAAVGVDEVLEGADLRADLLAPGRVGEDAGGLAAA